MSRVPADGSTSELAGRVASLANRLRLVQFDFADDAPEGRRGALEDEVARALDGVMPSQREEFLERLKELFPAWDANVAVAPRAEAAAGASRFDERELKSSSFLVERLVAIAPGMAEAERDAVVRRMSAAGLAPPPASGGGVPEGAAETLRKRLSVPAPAPLDAARVTELAGLLAELAVSLDQVVWNTWRAIAPRSELRRSGDLAKTLGRFAAGDQDVPRGQVKQDVERIRQLTAALISSVGQAGRQWAQRHTARFSVDAIKEAAGPGTLTKSQSVKSWEKYVELAGSLDAVALEAELLQTVAKFAEDLVRGINR